MAKAMGGVILVANKQNPKKFLPRNLRRDKEYAAGIPNTKERIIVVELIIVLLRI